jgi:hypothetical protein
MTDALSTQLNQTAPAGSVVTLIPDLAPPVDFIVDPHDPARYSCLVPRDVVGTGADVQCLAPQYLPCRQRCEAADGNTFPDGLPASGAWELRAFPLVHDRPAPPARADALAVRLHFQGAWVASNAYSHMYSEIYGGNGPIPYFGAALADFAAAGDLEQILDQLAALGDTHVMHYIGHGGDGYDEPNQPYGAHQLIPPANCWANHDLMRTCADSIIRRGLKPAYALDGEGGPDWIRANFEPWVAAMRADYDRLAYGPVMVCFDGVWPASWTVDQMQQMIPWMRGVLGDSGYLLFWYGNGPAGLPYLWVVNEDDYTQPWCDGLDGVLTTSGVDEAEGASLANKAQYMVRDPNYSQFQPSFSAPFVLQDCSRGPRVWGLVEWNTYGTVRDPNQALKPSIDAARARMVTMNIPCWG